jgi:hypothetical protein
MDLQHPMFFQVYGPPKSGKTHLLKYILLMMRMMKLLDWVNVFSGSAHDDEWDFLPKRCLITDSEEVRKRLGCGDSTQTPNIYTWYLKNKLIPYCKTTSGKGLTILDDLTGSCDFKSDEWSQLFTNFRHYCKKPGDKMGNFSVILSSHYAFKIPPVVREAAFMVAIFQQCSMNAIKAVYQSYCQITGEKYADWNAYQQRFTDREKHTFILFKKEPKPGQKYFQPAVCPPLPTNAFVPFKEEPEKKEDKKRKRNVGTK